jgi:hypothetical protein
LVRTAGVETEWPVSREQNQLSGDHIRIENEGLRMAETETSTSSRAGGTPVTRTDRPLPPMDPRPLRPVHHGQTGAMWTGVVIVMVAFAVGGLAMLGPNWTLFIIACVLGVAGIVAGLVLQALGFGLYEKKSASDRKS